MDFVCFGQWVYLGAVLIRVDFRKDAGSVLYRTLNFISVFSWLSVRWNGSVNLILTIQHDLWTDLLISVLACTVLSY